MIRNKVIHVISCAALCFATLFPSWHAVHHFIEEFSHEHCHHQYHEGQNEINHSHHHDDCFGCDFVFSPAAFLIYSGTSDLVAGIRNTHPNFFYQNAVTTFKGYFFSLRGPPSGTSI